jgi:peptidoglycan L-alanyl-D-glutamate endopeptidase CwlK
MSTDTSILEPEFREKIEKVLEGCKRRGFELRPFFTVRDVLEQARLWRQSRPLTEIERVVRKLRREGASFIADSIEKVGPQYGRWATNNLPGQSWHQWGMAIDCFVIPDDGHSVWSSKHPGYLAYAEESRSLGLTAGYFWTRQDAVHVQNYKEGVRSRYTWVEINQEMKERFASP